MLLRLGRRKRKINGLTIKVKLKLRHQNGRKKLVDQLARSVRKSEGPILVTKFLVSHVLVLGWLNGFIARLILTRLPRHYNYTSP